MSSAPMPQLSVLLVDDEALARARLRQLLGQLPQVSRIAEAAHAVAAMASLSREPVDLVLLDIHMPGMDGLGLAAHLQSLPQPPAVVFVTAHAAHALQAFDLAALDYLTKPVRLERLQVMLQKVERYRHIQQGLAAENSQQFLVLQERGHSERVPLDEVLYLKAEAKYLTVRTRRRSWLWENSLNEVEARFPQRFLRIHRNALVAHHAMRALTRGGPASAADEGDSWVLQLHGVDDTLAVSRRQLPAVRAVLAGATG